MTGNNASRLGLPIACTLDATEGAARLARWKALSAGGRPTVRLEPESLAIHYRATSVVRSELNELVAAERQCCTFADWAVSEQSGELIVTVRSSSDGLQAIAAMFGRRP